MPVDPQSGRDTAFHVDTIISVLLMATLWVYAFAVEVILNHAPFSGFVPGLPMTYLFPGMVFIALN
jgi:hypothetical protein